MIDINDKDKYQAIFERSLNATQSKYIGLLKNLDKEGSKPEEDNYTILVYDGIKELKDGNFLFSDTLKQLKKKYKIIQRADVPLDVIKQVREKAGGFSDGVEGARGSQGEAKEAFDEMLSYALKNNASDIHILSLFTGCEISLKIDGELEVYKTYSYEFAKKMISAVYTSDAKDIEGTHFNENESQQGVIPKTIDGIDIQLRFQSSNVFGGFKVVMRILNLGRKEESDDKLNYLRLDKLGYAPSHIDNIENGIAKPVGATIIAGVTGSGKSTTLKHLLMYMNHMNDFRKVFYTLEDPPEYLIPGVTQIGVSRNEKSTNKNSSFAGSPYKKPLAVLMRFDPDVIMIGEIRDEATAEGLTKATESGHKVLSTTHASSALEIIKRLYNFHVGSNDMASPSFLSCLIYQKLMPLLCPHCKIKLSDKLEDANLEERFISLKNRLKDVADLKKDPIYIRNECGCDKCKYKGTKGRSVCAETIIPDLTLLTYFRDNKMIEAKEYWRSLSDKNRDSDNFTGKTVLEHAIYKMRQGIISPVDVETELGPINAAYKEWLEIEKREQKTRESMFNQYLFSGIGGNKKQVEEDEFDI